MNQDPIIKVKLSSVFIMKRASFVVNSFKHVMNVVVYTSHSVEQFFCSRRGELVVVLEVYGV